MQSGTRLVLESGQHWLARLILMNLDDDIELIDALASSSFSQPKNESLLRQFVLRSARQPGASMEKRCDKFIRLGLTLRARPPPKELQGKQLSLPTGKLAYAQLVTLSRKEPLIGANELTQKPNHWALRAVFWQWFLIIASEQIVSH